MARIKVSEAELLCLIRGVEPIFKVERYRRTVPRALNKEQFGWIDSIERNCPFVAKGVEFISRNDNWDLTIRDRSGTVRVIQNPVSTPKDITHTSAAPAIPDTKRDDYIAKLEAIVKTREVCTAEVYDIIPTSNPNSGKSTSVVIALLSDVHIDETVKPETVMGLNEYNAEIGKERVESFFINLAKLISHSQKNYNINELILAGLGDFIGGWIHEELQQTNSMSPLSAVSYVQSIIVSGLKYLHSNLDVKKITFIGVVGNHSRLTKKNQYANATDVNLEYFMYKTIEATCNELGLNKLHFIIPQAEAAIIEVFGKRLFFTHGTNIKYGGGIGGIIVPVSRWFANTSKAFKVDFAFIGHFHQSLFTKRFCINGSVKGVDAYAVGKMLDLEAAQQTMIILNEKRGFTQYSPIFL